MTGASREAGGVPGPLASCRVLVTRAREQAGSLSAQIAARGGEVVEFPVLRVVPPPDPSRLDAFLRSGPGQYHWIVFTSVNGVRAFVERLRELGLDGSPWRTARLAAIGPVTGAELERAGFTARVIPREYRGEALLAALAAAEPLQGKRIALVRALEAREVLPDGLRRLGARVDVIPAYQTVPDGRGAHRIGALLDGGQLHVITFASPSAVKHFAGAIPDAAARVRRAGTWVACIGPVTAEAARRHGFPVHVAAEEYTSTGLVDALAEEWQRRRASVRNAQKEGTKVLEQGEGIANPTATSRENGAVLLRQRPRRLRASASIRHLVRETRLAPEDFIYPLFVIGGRGVAEDVPSLPGIQRLSVDLAVEEARRAWDDGIRGLLLFGIPDRKDEVGSSAWDPEGPVQRAVGAIKDALPEMWVATDVCLCQYTDHGHCGVVKDGRIDNDASLPLLTRVAVSHAEAGADMVAPSDMMDGRVAAIREGLDAAGYEQTGIMAYSAKFASGFYGPFRDAAGSAPQFGDRRTYQMDPGNVREALREVALDVEEGADMVMVKPALAYLDVVAAVRRMVNVPVVVYNVSGEYALVKAAAQAGWIDEEAVVAETLLSMKRAGADLIITYFAREVARSLRA